MATHHPKTMPEITTAAEAVGFITQAAWKQHNENCRCLVGVPPRVGNEAICSCGAREHNEKVKTALLIIGKAARRRK